MNPGVTETQASVSASHTPDCYSRPPDVLLGVGAVRLLRPEAWTSPRAEPARNRSSRVYTWVQPGPFWNVGRRCSTVREVDSHAGEQTVLHGKRAGKDDHTHSRYADINTAIIPTCTDFLTNVGLTTGSA